MMAYGNLKRVHQQQLIEDYLLMCPGQKFDAMQAVRGVFDRWGISIDWHEAASVLDKLYHEGKARFVGYGYDNFSLYRIEH